MNKIKLLILTVLVSAGVAVAQNVTTPYSMYGYGILGDRATSMQRQMGSVGYAMNSGRQINVMNPASYASIDSLTFLFDIGADLSVLWQKEGELKQRTTGGGLDYVTMQFPICKFMGGSIGMLPYSSVGYAFGKSIDHGAMENQGNGGINQAYIGLAGKYAGFSLGVNFAYSFGNIINDVYSTPNSAGQSLFEHVMEIRDWDVNLGLQYTARLSRTERITAGVTFSPKKSLHGNTWATIQELKHESVPDTVASMKISGNYYTPMSIGAGIAYKHERNSRWMLEADFTFQQWSKAKYSAMYENADPDNMVFQGMDFNNRTKFALGGEFVPKIRGNYVQRISYRAGAYYNNDYLNIRGNRVREYGVTAGFGLNTPEGKTMINLGIEWKHRQAHPNPLLTENYLNITLGVNINEVWFFKRPINDASGLLIRHIRTQNDIGMRVMRKTGLSMAVTMALVIAAGSCTQETKVDISRSLNPAGMPSMVTHNISTLISDSGVTQYKIVAPVWYVYDEVDTPYWLFPKGLYLQKYDPKFNVVATVAADSARFFKMQKLWRLEGNVEMTKAPKDLFLSERVFWDQRRARLYSDTFIHIENETHILEGTGFESNERLTKYRILHPSGIFPVERDNLKPDPK